MSDVGNKATTSRISVPRSTSVVSASTSSLKVKADPPNSTRASPMKGTKPSRRNSPKTYCDKIRCEKFHNKSCVHKKMCIFAPLI